MTRLFMGAVGLLVLAACATLRADEAPKPVPAGEQFKALEKEFSDAMAEFQKLRKQVKTREELQQLFEDKYPVPKFAGRFLALAEKDPKDPAAVDCVVWIVTHANGPDRSAKKAMEMLADYAASDRIAPACLSLGGGLDPANEKLLRTVLEKNTNKEVLAAANYGLAEYLKEAAEIVPQLKDNERFRARAESFFGADKFKQIMAIDPKAATKEMEGLFETVAKKYADVKVSDRALGKLAAAELFEIRNLQVGMTAPKAEAEGLDGKKASLADYKGKVVVLDFWATWCGPCRSMIPHERELVKRMHGKPFAFVSVSADDEKDALTSFLDRTEMPWNHWWAGNGGDESKDTLASLWNVHAFPTLYVVDAKGVIRHKFVGVPDGDVLDDAVDALVKEAEESTKGGGGQ